MGIYHFSLAFLLHHTTLCTKDERLELNMFYSFLEFVG